MPSPSNGNRPIWFATKRYGWGWGLPVAWQGWVVLVLWLAVVMVVAPILARYHWVAFAAFMAIMVGIFVSVCYFRGEPPRWRWGE